MKKLFALVLVLVLVLVLDAGANPAMLFNGANGQVLTPTNPIFSSVTITTAVVTGSLTVNGNPVLTNSPLSLTNGLTGPSNNFTGTFPWGGVTGVPISTTNPFPIVYIAPTGNDASAGTASAPMASLQAASQKLAAFGGGELIAYGGVYTNNFINITNAQFNLWLHTVGGQEANFICASNVFAGWSNYSGNVYTIKVADAARSNDLVTTINNYHTGGDDPLKQPYLFEYGSKEGYYGAGDLTAIPPWAINMVNGARLEHFRLRYVATTAGMTNGTWTYQTNNLYVQFSDSGSPNGRTCFLPSAQSAATFIQGNTNQSIRIDGIKNYFYYNGFYALCHYFQCDNSLAFGAWNTGFAGSPPGDMCVLSHDEAAACLNEGTVWSSASGNKTYQVKTDYCWWHDNEREGDGNHYYATETATGCWGSYNGKIAFVCYNGSRGHYIGCEGFYNGNGSFWVENGNNVNTNVPTQMVLDSCKAVGDAVVPVSQNLGDGGSLIANTCEIDPPPGVQFAAGSGTGTGGSGLFLNNCFTCGTNFPVFSAGNGTVAVNNNNSWQPVVAFQNNVYGPSYIYPIICANSNGVSLIVDGSVRGESLPMYQFLTNDFRFTNTTTIPTSGYWDRTVLTKINATYLISFYFFFQITNTVTGASGYMGVNNVNHYYGNTTAASVSGGTPVETTDFSGSGYSLNFVTFGGQTQGTYRGTILASSTGTPININNTQLWINGGGPTNPVFLKAGSYVKFEQMP